MLPHIYIYDCVSQRNHLVIAAGSASICCCCSPMTFFRISGKIYIRYSRSSSRKRYRALATLGHELFTRQMTHGCHKKCNRQAAIETRQIDRLAGRHADGPTGGDEPAIAASGYLFCPDSISRIMLLMAYIHSETFVSNHRCQDISR